jgi:hypothetical protein
LKRFPSIVLSLSVSFCTDAHLTPNFSTVTTDAAAATAGTAIVYNGIDGKLFYNPNLMTAEFGGTSDGYFAQLTTGLNLTHNDFILTI